jgi:oxygen-independent coproporphyrinogen-3 oxidase
MKSMQLPYSLYFHIPFCTHRCAYCDFNTYAGQENLIPLYVEGLCREIRSIALSAKQRLQVHTLFFGGGTPSLLTPAQFDRILQTVHENFSLVPSFSSGSSGTFGTSDPSVTSDSFIPSETSLEANPGTVTLNSLRGFHQAGFNRISFGVQSFDARELRQLERTHDPCEVLDAFRLARKAGFDNINLDLIYGLPEQSLSHWQASLRHAVDLGPEHLSLYALTIEPGTPFGRWAARGLLPMPDPDLAADMYETATDYLEGQGYEQYEISNWSKPGFQCQHNLQYWLNQPYLGFGAGAHGCAIGLRIANVLHIKGYLNHFSSNIPIPDPPFPISPATATKTVLNSRIEMQETMLLGLRLTRTGISPDAFHARFGRYLMDVFGKEINELVELGLIECNNSHLSVRGEAAVDFPFPKREGAGVRETLHLTRRGRLLGNQVFMRFVDE